MSECLLSIVVPYYNQPENLQDLLNSLERQTISSFEVIVVDDCSEKSPENIIGFMREKGMVIHYIRQKERQYTLKARFAGMRIAKGDYLAFMDSDDLAYQSDSYEKVVRIAQDGQADIVHFITVQKNDLGFVVPRPETMPFAGELHGRDIITQWLDKGCVSHSVWNKLYSKRLYEKVVGQEHTVHIFRIEDFYLTCYFLFFAQKYVSCDVPVYYYKPPRGKGSLEKLAGRAADSWQMYKALPEIFAGLGLDGDNVQKLRNYLHTLALLNHGTAHIHLKNRHEDNLKYSDEILNVYKKYAATEDIIAGLILSASYNAEKCLSLYRYMTNG